jgi:hypothetical protein
VRWLRIRKPDQQCRETIRQLLQLATAQPAHRPLQRSDRPPGSCPQNLQAIRRGMDLHAALIPFMSSPLDPTACDEPFQHVADRGPLHSEACGQARGGYSGLFTNAGQRPVYRDRRIGHAFELAIQRAHAIDERARRQQRVAFEGASTGEPACIAGWSLSS